MARVGIYPGSFDPVTNGHLDVIKRASGLFDKLIVIVAVNPQKRGFFSEEERISFLERCCKDFTCVEVRSFSGLLLDAAKDLNAIAVIRGLRAVSDFEWEFQMALMNRKLDSRYETIFLMTSPEYSYVSSTMIKEIAALGGDLTPFLPEFIVEKLKKKIKSNTDNE
ncbi:MAG: pantetheine-phosphate adenylyltransferase [Verrucomicrobiota bacterium]|nr:pantetheine-phosphate adenylyltransferase [Verrucomicrobiota bacterium]